MKLNLRDYRKKEKGGGGRVHEWVVRLDDTKCLVRKVASRYQGRSLNNEQCHQKIH